MNGNALTICAGANNQAAQSILKQVGISALIEIEGRIHERFLAGIQRQYGTCRRGEARHQGINRSTNSAGLQLRGVRSGSKQEYGQHVVDLRKTYALSLFLDSAPCGIY